MALTINPFPDCCGFNIITGFKFRNDIDREIPLVRTNSPLMERYKYYSASHKMAHEEALSHTRTYFGYTYLAFDKAEQTVIAAKMAADYRSQLSEFVTQYSRACGLMIALNNYQVLVLDELIREYGFLPITGAVPNSNHEGRTQVTLYMRQSHASKSYAT